MSVMWSTEAALEDHSEIAVGWPSYTVASENVSVGFWANVNSNST